MKTYILFSILFVMCCKFIVEFIVYFWACLLHVNLTCPLSLSRSILKFPKNMAFILYPLQLVWYYSLSLYLGNIFLYKIINLCSFCNCCKFSLTPHDHMRLYELYKSVLDIVEFVVAFCATNHRIIEHCKFCPCRCT